MLSSDSPLTVIGVLTLLAIPHSDSAQSDPVAAIVVAAVPGLALVHVPAPRALLAAMFIPSSSETPEESAVRVSPSVSVPAITRSPTGASLTSVTVTVTM